MNTNYEIIKKILSNDELCDKANSAETREIYIKQIENYLLSLCNSIVQIENNIEYINRYLRKFVLNKINKEEIFFNKVLLKLYKYNIKNNEYKQILNTFKYEEVKELLMQKYNQYVNNNTNINEDELKKILTFYYTTCENYIMPINYINYFTKNIIEKNIELEYEIMKYYYKTFTMYFASTQKINPEFDVLEEKILNDPYYDYKKKKIILYKQDIKNKIDYDILSDIFNQIKYISLIKSINNKNNTTYTFEQLKLVKEICITTIIGEEYYNKNYNYLSFTKYLKDQSQETTKQYLKSIGIEININKEKEQQNQEDKPANIDILFDKMIKNENPMLLKELIKNYPILACEYKSDRRKTLLNMLMDIYSKRKLLENLNKDLEWYNKKLENGEDEIIKPKIERLQNKILVCTSYINVMSTSINQSSMIDEDIIRSISALITYNTEDQMIKNDIYIMLCNIIPKKIKELCKNKNEEKKEEIKQKIIKCYLDSMGLVRNNIETTYLMKIYGTLQTCIKSFD